MAEDDVCQYDGTRLWFRGPPCTLDHPFIACIGGDETFGRFVDSPFPDAVQKQLGKTCANFGSLFAGVEALTRDQGLLRLANRAQRCVIQLPQVHGQSNRFYRVHPRRNDRFLEPTQDLLDLYPDIDFTEVHFVRHLLKRLQARHDARFEVIAHELRQSWLRSLGTFLGQLDPQTVLLHLQIQRVHTIEDDPIPVNASMVEALRPQAARVVTCSVAVSGASDTLEDMLFGTLQQPMAVHMLGPAAHRQIAEAVVPVLRDLNA